MRTRCKGFTLIELLVVVAIIALLVAILLPSLQSARQHAKAVVCNSNMHNVSTAMANYLFSSKATYPASYLYPDDEEGNYSVTNQNEGKPFGYLHWSYYLFEGGQVSDKAFQCPVMENGGAPRTNPGREEADWEAGQLDDTAQSTANDRMDKQAPRMAYAANAALMPRNKFTSTLSGGKRVNVFVKESSVKHPGATILVAELLDNWKAIGKPESGGIVSKSHRPINPFYHVGSGFDEYTGDVQTGFIYGTPGDQDFYGLEPTTEVKNATNILDKTSGRSQLNAVGRHHPNSNSIYAKKYGGTANFLFADGHAEAMTALDTVTKRYWGTHYSSITGENKVMNMSKITR
jgi:prepilin-type N-terminal cleavage/methylation domain-containing protein/prepilin-type processing-associated H-X9-DG protein